MTLLKTAKLRSYREKYSLKQSPCPIYTSVCRKWGGGRIVPRKSYFPLTSETFPRCLSGGEEAPRRIGIDHKSTLAPALGVPGKGTPAPRAEARHPFSWSRLLWAWFGRGCVRGCTVCARVCMCVHTPVRALLGALPLHLWEQPTDAAPTSYCCPVQGTF